MHAAIVKLSIDAAQAFAAADGFTRDIRPGVRAAPGLVADYWFEPASGQGLACLIFDTEEEARAATPPRSSWQAPGLTIDAIDYRRIAVGPGTPEVDRVKKYETVVSSGQSALKAMLAMNGGAVVVFLTFISHLLEKETRTVAPESMQLFVFAFSWFIAGIVLTLASYGTIFVTNVLSSEGWERLSNGAFVVTVIFGLLGFVCFISGGWTAMTAFEAVGDSIIARP